MSQVGEEVSQKQTDWGEADGENQTVDFRDNMMHTERNDYYYYLA